MVRERSASEEEPLRMQRNDMLAELTRRLAAVPAFTPQLVRLAWLLCDDQGGCDMELAAQHAVDLEDALHEARAYSKAVEDLRWRLSRLT